MIYEERDAIPHPDNAVERLLVVPSKGDLPEHQAQTTDQEPRLVHLFFDFTFNLPALGTSQPCDSVLVVEPVV